MIRLSQLPVLGLQVTVIRGQFALGGSRYPEENRKNFIILSTLNDLVFYRSSGRFASSKQQGRGCFQDPPVE
jgi:hypothetical protein